MDSTPGERAKNITRLVSILNLAYFINLTSLCYYFTL
jgi:hypothetical protein